MGQAKVRGSFEQRKAESILREQENAKRLSEELRLRFQQEDRFRREREATKAQLPVVLVGAGPVDREALFRSLRQAAPILVIRDPKTGN